MQEGAGPEWNHIDQTTLEEVEKSWANSSCGEVEFNISDRVVVSVCTCVTSASPHLTIKTLFLL